jgi:hypothetical protein
MVSRLAARASPRTLAPIATLAVTLGLVACVHPNYECSSDRDCDIGQAGRCEFDRRCTAVDPSCDTNRRYSDHSGPLSNTCFDDSALPLNLCAAGQPPAKPEQCAADVCQVLPGCCSTGWSEACVRQAQIQCDVACDTRIAITANRGGGRTELWDVRWNGATWSARLDARQSVLSWLTPPPGSTEPRLAGFANGAFLVEDVEFPVATTHNYLEATPVDFDRDGRATAVLGFTDNRGIRLEIVKLDDGSSREVATVAATRLSWGDVDHDGFPDGIAGAASSTRYNLLSNIESAEHLRDIDDRVVTNVTGGTSATMAVPPPIRSFDWIDVDADRQLDVVAYGYSVDVHLGRGDAIGTSVLVRIDCDPPINANGCDAVTQADQAFAGAALPSRTVPALVVATHPTRALYRAELRGQPANTSLSPYLFPPSTCGATCVPILAVVTRDLDGDHALDVIAIDADLQLFTGLAKDNLQLRAAFKVPTAAPSPGFLVVRASVTGAPR